MAIDRVFRLELAGGERFSEFDDDFGSYKVREFTFQLEIARPSIQEIVEELSGKIGGVDLPRPLYLRFFNPDEDLLNCRRDLSQKKFSDSDIGGVREIKYHLMLEAAETGELLREVTSYINSAAGELTGRAPSPEKSDALAARLIEKIAALKKFRDNLPDSDSYDSEQPGVLCHEIVLILKEFAFADEVPAGIIAAFSGESWILDHEFKYWHHNHGTGSNSLWSCRLARIEEMPPRVLEALRRRPEA